MNTMVINGYQAVISYDPEINMFRGEFIGINGGADFYATTVEDFRKEGEMSLKAFLAMCAEDDEAPESTDDSFEKADLMDGAKVVRRGRTAGRTKASQTVRFDMDILAAFKSTGKGWQTRMNDALREWLKEHPLKHV